MENSSEEKQEGSFSNWLQENLRIIISIVIVILIAGGIYSYSKRTEAPMATNTGEQKIAEEGLTLEGEPGSEKESAVVTEGAEAIQGEKPATEKTPAAEKSPTEDKVTTQEKGQASSVATSQETEQSFIETAGKGDGSTHLARKALANYLEKNPDSNLSAEHKIYIEDYLRKRVQRPSHINTGTSIEFSKNMIQDSIAKAKTLNESQLNNLKRYSARVPSLS